MLKILVRDPQPMANSPHSCYQCFWIYRWYPPHLDAALLGSERRL
jgi:hypothetical protein